LPRSGVSAGRASSGAGLDEARAALLAQGCRFATSWVALSLLSARAVDGGAEPETYGPNLQRDFAYALEEGWCTLDEFGRLMITELGRAEWKLELLESYG